VESGTGSLARIVRHHDRVLADKGHRIVSPEIGLFLETAPNAKDQSIGFLFEI